MKSLIAFPAVLLLAATLEADSLPDPAALLRQSDHARNGWNSFVVRVRITTYESGKEDEQHLFEVSMKGFDRSYVEFLSPRDKGRHMLMLGDDMWVYLPDTSRPIRITPMERLSGNASNGDVARTNYAADYDAKYLRVERVDGIDCHVLDLSARRKGATYRRIHYWLRTDSAFPVKADYFLASGKHTKSATFDEYRTVYGQRVLRRMTIYDRIRKDSRSVIEYLSLEPRELPDKLFHQGRTERF